MGKYQLKYHVASVHKEIKNFQCLTCGKTFYRKNTLNSHVNEIHLKIGVGHVKCVFCKKTFVRKSYLTFHIDTVHNSKRKTYKCDQCSTVFKVVKSLKNHTCIK